MAINKPFIRRGLTLPIQQGADGRFLLRTGIDRITDSVLTIGQTQLESLPFARDAGWEKDRVIFLPNTAVRQNLIAILLSEAIEEGEPDVYVADVQFTAGKNKLTARAVCVQQNTGQEIAPVSFDYIK